MGESASGGVSGKEGGCVGEWVTGWVNQEASECVAVGCGWLGDCVSACLYACACACTSVYVCICMCVCVCVRAWALTRSEWPYSARLAHVHW